MDWMYINFQFYRRRSRVEKKLNIDDVDRIREYITEDIRSFEQLSGINTEIWTSEIHNGERID